MAAYVIAYLDVTDEAAFATYRKAAGPTIALYGGKTLVVDGRFDVREGFIQPKSIVVIEFDTLEQARRWYESPEYSATIPSRQRSASTSLVIVEGRAAATSGPAEE